MTQRRVENTRVHFWTFPPVTVKENDVHKKTDLNFTVNKILLFNHFSSLRMKISTISYHYHLFICFITIFHIFLFLEKNFKFSSSAALYSNKTFHE